MNRIRGKDPKVSRKRPARTGGSPLRGLKPLGLLALLAIGLAGWNAYRNASDVRLATGPVQPDQLQFFLASIDRPDTPTFFKGLEPHQRRLYAENLSRHDDPRLADLIGILLADFDAGARGALTRALAIQASRHPEAVAQQLKHAGSFQRLSVFEVLSGLGAAATPVVAKMLEGGTTRANASAYLVTRGREAVPPLLGLLEHEDVDVRLAAADALGKIRAPEAAVPITARLRTSTQDEFSAYLGALSAIGDPRSETLLLKIVEDPKGKPAFRAQAALGLGRIGTPGASAAVWELSRAEEPEVRAAAWDALALCGDAALTSPSRRPDDLLRVAGTVRTALSQSILGDALASSERRMAAADASHGRPELVPALDRALASASAERNGNAMEAVVEALATTDDGLQVLNRRSEDPEAAGFVRRRLGIRKPR
jgi:HEAT repeat protein